MFKKALPFLLALTLVGCQLIPTEPDPEAEPEEETPTESADSVTVDFYEPIEWSAEKVFEGNEEQFWKAGTFQGGDYDGQTLVVQKIIYEGPSPSSLFRYAVDESSDEWTLLVPYSYEFFTDLAFARTVDQDMNIEIEALNVPNLLPVAYEDTEVKLVGQLALLASEAKEHADYYVPVSLEMSDGEPNAFVQLYEARGLIFGESPDGVLASYMVIPKIFSDNEADYASLSTELSFTDQSGEVTSQEFSLFGGGCGLGSGLALITASTKEEDELELAGDLDGEPAYWLKEAGEQPKDPQGDPLRSAFHSAYASYSARLQYDIENTEEPMPIEEYVHSGNFFFIKMDNGKFTPVYNKEHAPMAECGKPVIYLYPEEETLVSVRVDIPTFTKVEPFYGPRGWFVKAKPTGELWNIFDGKTYPYLFWEGQSDEEILLEDAGFTLAVSEVAKTLPSLLVDMGLNAQETADFMEFWLPELQEVETPYIEFHFVGNTLMDKVAPLHIYPQPDQVIRLFMFYEPSAEPGLEAPEYKAPERYGFTVVEWGGSLY